MDLAERERLENNYRLSFSRLRAGFASVRDISHTETHFSVLISLDPGDHQLDEMARLFLVISFKNDIRQ